VIGGIRAFCYEKPVSRTSSPRTVSPSSIEGWLKLVISASLGTIIGGAFGLATDWSSRDQHRCTVAMQFLGDETPNPALSPSHWRRLAAQAHSRLLSCLGDDR
jgi:hypothetical protein